MSLPRVAVSSISFSQNTRLCQELAAAGFAPVVNSAGKRMDAVALAEFIAAADAEAAIIGLEPVDAAVLKRCARLKFISKYGVGLDNLDQAAMAQRQVQLGWTGGVNRRSVSELVLSFALGHLRNVLPSVHNMRHGKWLKNGGRQLSDAVVGIVGLGNIGSDLASLLRAFGAKVLYCDIANRQKEAAANGAISCSYRTLVEQSDVLSFHVPQTAETREMFGPEQIAWCRPHTLIVNTARGHIVDFSATCAAVKAGQLGGFAADVFPEEPADLSSWADVQNLYFTPHIGGNSQEAVLAMGRSAIEHIVRYYQGRKD